MKSAVTLEDANGLKLSEVFDLDGLYKAYASSVKRDDRQGHFHPSTAGMCGRRNVYEYACYPKNDSVDPDNQEVFDLGHAIHELVGNKLGLALNSSKTFGYEFHKEVPYDAATDNLIVDCGIGGTCDGLLKIWTDTWVQRSIIEIKSINAKRFEELIKPHKAHLMQAHIYAFRYDCPIIYVWYYCKDNSKRKVYPCVYKQSLFEEALNRFEGWKRHAEKGTLPDREEDWYMCPRCEYREVCDPVVVRKLKKKRANKLISNLSVLRRAGRLK